MEYIEDIPSTFADANDSELYENLEEIKKVILVGKVLTNDDIVIVLKIKYLKERFFLEASFSLNIIFLRLKYYISKKYISISHYFSTYRNSLKSFRHRFTIV